VLDNLQEAGWDCASLSPTSTVFASDLRIVNKSEHVPAIKQIHSSGRTPSWALNYPALSMLLNGQYYTDYQRTFGLMGLPVMSHTAWEKLVAWVGKHVELIASSSCEQVRERIIQRGDKFTWKASFDGFYLTRGHHSNNSSATLHDHSSDKIAWFAHRTKRGPGANWEGTSGGAEGDMLRTMLEDVKAKGFVVRQLIMDHNTSGGNIAGSVFPDVRIIYCGNHTAKTFHRDLMKIKSIPCKVSKIYNILIPAMKMVTMHTVLTSM